MVRGYHGRLFFFLQQANRYFPKHRYRYFLRQQLNSHYYNQIIKVQCNKSTLTLYNMCYDCTTIIKRIFVKRKIQNHCHTELHSGTMERVDRQQRKVIQASVIVYQKIQNPFTPYFRLCQLIGNISPPFFSVELQ